MRRAWLEAELARGRSIESIARDVEKHPSTVAYWVNKHQLVSRHARKHAARGGIDRELLESLVRVGLTVRAIAAELDVSYSTVRHWLRRYGLETQGTSRRRAVATTLRKRDDGSAEARCPIHGLTTFGPRSRGGWRCLKCRADAVAKRRRLVKATLVREAGGRCVRCGYDRSLAALQFHHRDPTSKQFHIAYRGVTRSIAAARAEADKCILLCANCHAEIEAAAATLRRSGRESLEGPG